jgi:hypothetical protein
MAGKRRPIRREYEYLLLAIHKVSCVAMFDLDRHLANCIVLVDIVDAWL